MRFQAVLYRTAIALCGLKDKNPIIMSSLAIAFGTHRGSSFPNRALKPRPIPAAASPVRIHPANVRSFAMIVRSSAQSVRFSARSVRSMASSLLDDSLSATSNIMRY
jgi:hypothetical protein